MIEIFRIFSSEIESMPDTSIKALKYQLWNLLNVPKYDVYEQDIESGDLVFYKKAMPPQPLSGSSPQTGSRLSGAVQGRTLKEAAYFQEVYDGMREEET